MREKVEWRIGENGRRVALGWSRRCSKLELRREKANPKLSSWKAIEGSRHGSVWGRRV